MNILFLFQRFSFENSTIYLDLVNACVSAGHSVYLLAGTSGEVFDARSLKEERGCQVAYVSLPDQFHAGKIKKGLVQLLIEPIFLRTLKRLLWDKKIDIIAYPTPPITLAGVVKKARAHYKCMSYLMLKDIFPQNAVDLGMMSTSSPVFKYFRAMEKRLYRVSDVIGCMSEANVEYVLKHNPETKEKLELFPNTVELKPEIRSEAKGDENGGSGPLRFIFGGNLGKPQAVDLLLAGIKRLQDEGFTGAEFLIIGEGTDAGRVEEAAKRLGNLTFKKQVPRDEYEALLSAYEVGIISLSPRFTIPNFPSRLLSYMQLSKPVLVVCDSSTDMPKVVCDMAGCGFYVPSEEPEAFAKMVKDICKTDRQELTEMGIRGRKYLAENYEVSRSVRILEEAMKRSGTMKDTGL